MKLYRIAATAAVTLALLSPAAANAAQQPEHRCSVTAHVVGLDPLEVVAGSSTADCISPQVTIQSWVSPSADGHPLSAQVLDATGFDGVLPVWPKTVDIVLAGAEHDCYVQLDIAYGFARQNLSVPYADNLIRAWHYGSHICTPPPTPSPGISISAAPSPSSPPAPSATPVVTTAPATTSAPPTTPPALTPTPSATVSLVPPVTLTKPAPTTTTAKPRKKPHATPKPTTPAPVHTPKATASGCIASGCTTTTPPSPKPAAAKPTLPYTGGPTWQMVTIGVILIAAGSWALLIVRRLP